MPNPLSSARLLLGVTGSIACYKIADLASKMRQAGAQVDVILTEAAQKFVSPLTFQSVTGRPAHVDADLWGGEGHVLHIGLAEAADLMVIAPATANTLAKLAHGQADNLLTIAALAARCPLLVVPAMDGGMWQHAATQANIATLRTRGVTILGPVSGHLASGLAGEGRMVEPIDIQGQIRQLLASHGPLAGRHVVVSAGGTQEALDPVRMLSNRSSGKQGFAMAQAALDAGARVTLIAAPTALPTPAGAERVSVTSASNMLAAIQQSLRGADALIMAAAVADFRPAQQADQKIKKTDGPPTIEMVSNPDILKTIAESRDSLGFDGRVIGFAAESENLLENAQKKVSAKKLDVIVANNIASPDAGFQVETNRVTLLFADGRSDPLPLMSKFEVAERVIRELILLLDV
jgi:phosphopantothenoylcysteine decarboxylase/phosphopantothenate--cysteine ligase